MSIQDNKMEKAKVKLDGQIEAADQFRQEQQEKVVRLRNTLMKAKQRTPSRKDEDSKIFLRNGRYFQNWTTPCPKFMREFQPNKENPNEVYLKIR